MYFVTLTNILYLSSPLVLLPPPRWWWDKRVSCKFSRAACPSFPPVSRDGSCVTIQLTVGLWDCGTYYQGCWYNPYSEQWLSDRRRYPRAVPGLGYGTPRVTANVGTSGRREQHKPVAFRNQTGIETIPRTNVVTGQGFLPKVVPCP